LPLLASFLGSPYEPSPYAPVSRSWWNELYLDFAARPELASCPEAIERLGRAGSVCAPDGPFDARARYSVVREVLTLLADHVERTPGAARDDLRGFLTGTPVLGYARFRAAVERCAVGWRSWPMPPAEVMAGIADDSPDVRAHVYAQWAMRRQLDRLAESLGRRNQILGLDLPVGCHADGYDTFVAPERYAAGAAVGAPPDEFFGAGQDWGFPPVVVESARADGHAAFAAAVAAHAAVAGMLRIDHVMQLHRLWWVPDGLGAAEGAYVTQPAEELAAVLAIESHLGGCVIVGEDLGTVPDEVRDLLAGHSVAGMYVAQFEQPSWPGAELRHPPTGCVASVGTHDTPPFAAWARALESTWRDDRSGGEPESTGERAAQLANLITGLEHAGSLEPGRWGWPAADELASLPAGLIDAVHAALVWRLGASEAACVLVALDDLAGTTSPQNVPGTPSDRPNWVVRLATPYGELLDGYPAEVLTRLQGERLGAWDRARPRE
jgi:4-alpha-glucanotransferase